MFLRHEVGLKMWPFVVLAFATILKVALIILCILQKKMLVEVCLNMLL